jgi:AraC family transcriptional regulator
MDTMTGRSCAMLPDMLALRVLRTIDLRDVRIREVRAEGPAIVAAHHHASAHLTLVTSGTVTDTAGEAMEVLHAGDLLFRPAGVVHENMVAERGSRGLIIEVDNPFLSSVCNAWRHAPQSVRTDAKALQGLPFQVIEELTREDASSPLILRGLVLHMFGLGTRVLQPAPDAAPPWWVRAALEVINERYAQRLTIVKVAREIGVNPTRLREDLRTHHGNTFATLLRDRRIAAALTMFETELEMDEIARLCGFYDQPHFTRAFRAARGMTPHRYRSGRR